MSNSSEAYPWLWISNLKVSRFEQDDRLTFLYSSGRVTTERCELLVDKELERNGSATEVPIRAEEWYNEKCRDDNEWLELIDYVRVRLSVYLMILLLCKMDGPASRLGWCDDSVEYVGTRGLGRARLRNKEKSASPSNNGRDRFGRSSLFEGEIPHLRVDSD